MSRSSWRDLRDEFAGHASYLKDPQSGAMKLSAAYAELPVAERSEINQELDDWLASSDESLRFDAEMIVGEHRVRSAVPALRALADRLEVSPEPGSPYEWAKVSRLLAGLTDCIE